jgi:hypothetical protein
VSVVPAPDRAPQPVEIASAQADYADAVHPVEHDVRPTTEERRTDRG